MSTKHKQNSEQGGPAGGISADLERILGDLEQTFHYEQVSLDSLELEMGSLQLTDFFSMDPSLAQERFGARGEISEVLEEDPHRGAVISGRYRVLRTLSDGLLGALFEVEHLLLQRRFSLRLFHPMVRENRESSERIAQIAGAVSVLAQENIAILTDHGFCEYHGPYVVFEPMGSMESLAKRTLLEGGERLGLRGCLELARAVGSALSAAHDHGLVHGGVRSTSIVADTQSVPPRWKLIDFGLTEALGLTRVNPALLRTQYTAPEFGEGRLADPWMDQYALAAVIYEQLTGEVPYGGDPLGGGALRWEVRSCPPGIGEVLRRALSRDRGERYPSLEGFLEHLQVSSRMTLMPLPSRYERLGAMTEASLEQRSVVGSDIAQGGEVSSTWIKLHFASPEELWREYRRNVLFGGVLVPLQGERLAVGERVRLKLSFGWSEQQIELRGVVARSDEAGSAVNLLAEDRAELIGLLRGMGVAPGPDDVLEQCSDLGSAQGITPEEAFLLSRLSAPMPMRELRAMLSGVPIEIDDAVVGLIEKRMVRLHKPEELGVAQESWQASEVWEGSESAVLEEERSTGAGGGGFAASSQVVEASHSKVSRLRDRVIMLEEEGNFLAARAMLQRAIRFAPQDVWFQAQLARLLLAFGGETGRARALLARVLSEEPQNAEYRELALQVKRRHSSSLLTLRFEKSFECEPVFVRNDEELQRLWLCLDHPSPSRRVIQAVDYGRGRSYVCARGKTGAQVVRGNRAKHAVLAQLRGRQDSKSRRLRQDILRASSYGPWLYRGPQVLASEPMGRYLLFGRGHSPVSKMQRGLFLLRQEGRAEERRLDPGCAEIGAIAIAPSGEQLVFAGRRSARGPWALFWSNLRGAAQEIVELQPGAQFAWRADGAELYLLQGSPAQLTAWSMGSMTRERDLGQPGLSEGSWLSAGPDGTVLLAGLDSRGEQALLWVDGSRGERRGVLRHVEPLTEGCLREDGWVAARTDSGGLYFGQFSSGAGGVVEGIRPLAGSLAGINWRAGEPLTLALWESPRFRVVTMRVDAFEEFQKVF